MMNVCIAEYCMHVSFLTGEMRLLFNSTATFRRMLIHFRDTEHMHLAFFIDSHYS